MKISEISALISAEELVLIEDMEIEKIEASDMMSDVLAYFEEGTALITSLSSPQVVRTASIVGIPLVIIVKNKPVSEELVKMARENRISLLKTSLSTFETCGILYCKGLKS
ncbi:MAG: hypothetical protein DRP30_01105 [Thermotoga sp.]|nr:MAG: hypothetical protein DRP30_01105 [Thermotoga sp.]